MDQCQGSLTVSGYGETVHSLEEDGWELESAEDRFAASGGKFEMPSRRERESLAVGDRCKLLFLFLVEDKEYGNVIGCERMWVQVEERNGEKYRGILESEPHYSDALARGKIIEFGPEHIASIFISQFDSRHPDFGNEKA